MTTASATGHTFRANANRLVTVIGGTGFLGRYVVKLLAQQGYTIRVIARHPDKALHLNTAGEVGQIVLTYGNLVKPESLQGKLAGSFAVVNLAGALFETSRQSFSDLHAKGAEKLAQMAKAAGVERFIQVSSLGVDKAVSSKYARTKVMGEKSVRAAFPEATILRPGVVFGPEDQFFNKFAALSALVPALPLIGGGRTRFAPVYAGDVAKAVLAVLAHAESRGETYELGGPGVYSFRELLEYINLLTRRNACLVPLPFGLASFIGFFTGMLPNPVLTRDQVSMLRHDNLVTPGAKNFAALGITPTSIESVVPGYLLRYAKPDEIAIVT
jgi:uncharacterized protein YbjT (DUF2867 family)